MKPGNLIDQRIPELDGLRAIAIGFMVLFHYFYLYGPQPLTAPWSYLLYPLNPVWSRVSLMFVLSGFLVCSILLDHRLAPNYFKVFYLRRIFRILPLYYLIVIIYWVLAAWGAGTWSGWLFGQPLPIWAYLTFTQSLVNRYAGPFQFGYWFGPIWTLIIEQQFYLILPLLIRFIAPKGLMVVSLIGIVGAVVFRIAVFFTQPDWWNINYLSLPARLDTLMLGVLVAIIFASETMRQRLVKVKWLLTIGLMGLLSGFVVFTIYSPDLQSFAWQSIGYTWIALIYSLLLLWVLTTTTGVIKKFLQHPLLTALGKISYGVYLFHFPILGLAYAWIFHASPHISTKAQAAVTLGALIVTIVLAAISWRFFEEPLVKIGHRFKYDPPLSRPLETASAPEVTETAEA